MPNSSWFKEGLPRLERVNALQQGQPLADSSLPKATPFPLVGLPQYLSQVVVHVGQTLPGVCPFRPPLWSLLCQAS